MNWYYVSTNEQKGPLPQADFDRLVQSGEISSSTLVWREGMAEWKPFSELAVSSPPLVPGSASGVVCSVCQHAFPLDQTIRLDNNFVCAGCKPMAMQRLREGVTSSAAEQIRKDHIKHEASVRSVGILYFLTAALLILGGVMGILANEGGTGGVTSLVLLVFGALQIGVGIGLRGLKSWARIPTSLLSGIGLLAFPIGTIINGYILYLVLSRKGKTVFSDDYKRIIEQTPHIKYKTSIVIWILLGLVVFLVGLALLVPLFAPRGR